MTMEINQLNQILEAALLVAGRPLKISELQKLFDEPPSKEIIQTALDSIRDRHADSGIELQEVASGFQFQVRKEYSPWITKLWEEKPPRYSRAFLETLALIAYRQPITRAEIEDIRGVGVNANIIGTLLEREWIKVVGNKEAPGRPELLGTTKTFLDEFGLKNLNELPTLAEIKDLEMQEAKLQQVQLSLESAEVDSQSPQETPILEAQEAEQTNL